MDTFISLEQARTNYWTRLLESLGTSVHIENRIKVRDFGMAFRAQKGFPFP